MRGCTIQSIMDLEWRDGQAPHPPQKGYLVAPEVIALWPELVHMLDSINALARAGQPELLKEVFWRFAAEGARRLDQKEKKPVDRSQNKGARTRSRNPPTR